MPDINTGDPKILTDFIKWGTKNYPAKCYLVDVFRKAFVKWQMGVIEVSNILVMRNTRRLNALLL
jgi:hypothetical protein